MTTTTVRTVPIDFAYDEDAYDEAAARFGKQFGVTLTMVNEVGPAGGWPEVIIEGPRANVLEALRDGYGFGDDPTVDDINPEDLLEPATALLVSHGTPWGRGQVEAEFAESEHGMVIEVVCSSTFSDAHTPLTIEAAEELRDQLASLLGQLGL